MIFSVLNGSFSYDRKAAASDMLLCGVDFSVHPGEVVAILGPNGSGKTTLLRCMTGLLKWTSGASFIDGKDIRSVPSRSLWQRIAYVPQARGLSSSATVEDMVLLGRSSHFAMIMQPGIKDIQIARETLERLGLSTLRHRSCNSLSGGELQMVLIARALASRPDMLVLDEPESNLDFKNQIIILNTISDLASEGISCVFNTHYPSHALQRAHRSLLLDKGGRYVFGDSGKVVTEENLAVSFGVEAIINEVETKHSIVKDVFPVGILAQKGPDTLSMTSKDEKEDNMETRIAILGIIVEDRSCTDGINELLHEYARYIIGRMGMPYEKKGLSIICVIIDAPEDIISTLSGKLGMLRGLSVKTTYSKR